VGDVDGNGVLDLVFGSWGGYLDCVDAAGHLNWKVYPSDEPEPPQLGSSPTLADADGIPSTLEGGSSSVLRRLTWSAIEGWRSSSLHPGFHRASSSRPRDPSRSKPLGRYGIARRRITGVRAETQFAHSCSTSGFQFDCVPDPRQLVVELYPRIEPFG
jgi:hypothetical protein